METVRFKKVFKFSPDGKSTTIAKAGDVHEVSDEIAASVTKSGAGVVVDLPAEKAEADEQKAADAEKAEKEKVDLTLAPKGDGKKGPAEDKSAKPGADKADSKE